MKPAEKPARAAFVGAIVAALFTLPGLGSGTLWDNSETAYGEVAREILLTHDWAVMHFNLAPYFIQPPLYFWLGALSAMVWGATSFALRFPSALATIALGAATGYAVARQAGTRVGIYASMILSSCLMQAVIGRLAIMDALLDLFVAVTIFCWFRALQTGRDSYFAWGWVAAGAGFLAKGLVAPVVALMVVVPYFFWNRRHEQTHAPALRAWILGLLCFAAIALPWPALLVSRYGWNPVNQLVGVYTIGRYTGVIENQSGPIWYYLPVIILGFFPWIAFFPMAVAYAVRNLRTQPDGDAALIRLSFVWCAVPFAFFSLAGTKLPNYVALELPALAALTARYFDSVVRKGGTRSAWISAGFVPLTIGMLAVAITAFAHNNRLGAEGAVALSALTIPGIVIFVGSLVTAIAVARGGAVRWAPYGLAIATLIAFDAITVVVLPQGDAFKPVPKLAAIIDRERRPGDAVAIQNMAGGNALIFYTHPVVDVLAKAGEHDTRAGIVDPHAEICGSARVWIVAPRERPPDDPPYGRHRTMVATDAKAALYLYDGPPCND
ncbi:MAG TPA: glycosyltransferase family 39 protein [Candidatus Baltobacteraceae bacterium]|jgi:4-amino-4-deoxy-L-arabinose transferase-like glycosyltransferase|nr:glycosyltransferase family 39 protein [Candidatus Baltobacteraceae bacterium]